MHDSDATWNNILLGVIAVLVALTGFMAKSYFEDFKNELKSGREEMKEFRLNTSKIDAVQDERLHIHDNELQELKNKPPRNRTTK